MIIILLTAGSFLSGSLMFSYWLGLLGRKNIKAVGDGNPGALNLWKATGYKLGLVGVLLDFLKGYLPVLLLVGSSYAKGFVLIPLALAPIAGHAFSPFLKGRGGKAIAVTFGVWSALTGFEASLAYAIILALLAGAARFLYKNKSKTSDGDGLQVVIGMLILSIYLTIRMFSVILLLIWLGNFSILLYRHRKEVTQRLKKTHTKKQTASRDK
ncbi:glycerol-3-phosphate acyltransferase [Paenibacillus paridis]|uniref:glycerol-3-phosphate acyltransferase n=1 Tax=Paenibacillus paridis TaxID=2583376 RepID=UPI00112142F9|nr:glycerol-3-phosphate acyltransferase [Paenibacillus paridis]